MGGGLFKYPKYPFGYATGSTWEMKNKNNNFCRIENINYDRLAAMLLLFKQSQRNNNYA